MARVSVLFPCRSAAAHLPEAIASMEAQSFGDFEVLAMDESSDPGTWSELYSWAQRDGRVRLLQPRVPGRPASLSTLLAAARGELVTRMDAHHVAGAGRLAAQVRLLTNNPGLAGCAVRTRFTPTTRGEVAPRHFRWLNAPSEPEAIAREMFVDPPLPPATLMVRRSALLGVGGYRDMGWPEEYDLQLRLWAAGYRLASVPDVLVHARAGAPGFGRMEPGFDGAAVTRCKAFFLRRTLLAAHDAAVIWGTGPLGRRFARQLSALGATVLAYVDPRAERVGRTIDGVPTLSTEALQAPGPHQAALLVIALGSAAIRDHVRAELAAKGLRELKDYVAVA